ncbi:hypothetical protein C8R47DRAFT_749233 [Mycena vitilis]|nr:hypothetical protein C8R47DRAFT_749233 [Mycena vitilis]
MRVFSRRYTIASCLMRISPSLPSSSGPPSGRRVVDQCQEAGGRSVWSTCVRWELGCLKAWRSFGESRTRRARAACTSSYRYRVPKHHHFCLALENICIEFAQSCQWQCYRCASAGLGASLPYSRHGWTARREQEPDCQKDWHQRGFHTFTGVHRISPQLRHWEPGIHSAAYTPPARERRPQPCEASHRPACWYCRSPGCVAPCNEELARRPAGVPVPRRTHGGSRVDRPKAWSGGKRNTTTVPGRGCLDGRTIAAPTRPTVFTVECVASPAQPTGVCLHRCASQACRYFHTVRVDADDRLSLPIPNTASRAYTATTTARASGSGKQSAAFFSLT